MNIGNTMFTRTFKPVDFVDIDCRCHKPLQNSFSPFKANVFRMQCGDKNTVVKDYSHANFFIRATICRLLIKREISALRKLQGIQGVPKLYGFYGKYGFAMQTIEGFHPDMAFFSDNPPIAKQLERLVEHFHKQGMTHNDLRLNNMIVDKHGCLFIIDYAATFNNSHKFNFLGKILSSILQITDQAKVIRVLQQSPSFKLTKSQQNILKKAKRLHILTDLWKSIRKKKTQKAKLVM